jgi:hypothetical protein
MWQGSDNFIIRNNITGISIGSNFNNFSQNNIMFDYIPEAYSSWREHVNFWDNGSVGNYWRDYAAKNPNASEIDNSGIGDKPYEVDARNIDHHPVMYPFDIENGTIALPTPEPQPEQESSQLLTLQLLLEFRWLLLAQGCLFTLRNANIKHVCYSCSGLILYNCSMGEEV